MKNKLKYLKKQLSKFSDDIEFYYKKHGKCYPNLILGEKVKIYFNYYKGEGKFWQPIPTEEPDSKVLKEKTVLLLRSYEE